MRLISTLLILGLAACADSNDDDVVPDTLDDEGGCVDGVCVLTGTILEDTTLTPDFAWVLRGGVFIGDDETAVTLTIEPGTTVYGESSTDGMLVIRRGARIVADGTAELPIVFTSSKNPGERSQGDWGGLILNGNAPVNSCDSGEELEGPCEAFGEGGTGWYGGDVATDDSGVLRYVRVEFAGNLVSPDNELNGIAFQGIGSGTVVDYVQVHQNADDGVEFFGGTVQAKHVLVTGIGDDGIDWTDGWTGSLQYAVVQQYAGTGDNGIEADNNADNNDAEPRSMPALANITLVGSPESDKSDLGLLLREGTGGTLSHVLAIGFNEACVDVDHDATFASGLDLRHSRLGCATAFVEDAEEPSTVQAWFEAGVDNTTDAVALTAPYDLAAPDFRPTTVVEATFDVSDSRLESAAYVGAFDATTDWTSGWITTAAN
jgi:hypothetical protein